MRQNSIRVLVLLATVSCGGTDSAPSAPALPFQSGAYQLSIVGSDAVFLAGSSTSVVACPGIGAANILEVAVEVTLQPDGSSWSARPSTPDAGDFLVQFGSGEGTVARGVSVSGSARGMAIDTRSLTQTHGNARVLFDPTGGTGLARLEGSAQSDTFATGTISTAVAFRNSAGTTVSCAAGTVSWILSRIFR